jgi:hypothetical protein
MDQDTGPPFAVRVNGLLDPTVSAMLFVETLSVPAVGADGDEPAPPLLDPPPALALALALAVGAGSEAEAVGVVTGALLAGEPPLPELGVVALPVGADCVALPVGADCDTLPVRVGDDEGDGDARGFAMAGVVPDGFAWPGL